MDIEQLDFVKPANVKAQAIEVAQGVLETYNTADKQRSTDDWLIHSQQNVILSTIALGVAELAVQLERLNKNLETSKKD